MMIKRGVFASLIPIFMVLLLSHPAYGCSCYARPAVLYDFEKAEHVITGRIASVEKMTEPRGSYEVGDIRTSTLVVTKVFKGSMKVGQELKFSASKRSDCRWVFGENVIGEDFLLYLGAPEKHFFEYVGTDPSDDPLYKADICGRSKFLKEAREDLAYLQNIEKARGRTRFSGIVSGPTVEGSSMAGVRIDIKGNTGSYSTTADKNGFFEIYDVPSGEYVVTIGSSFGWKISHYTFAQIDHDHSAPPGMVLGENQIPITIKKGRHSSLELYVKVGTGISGLVLSAEGRPVAGGCVTAMSTTLTPSDDSAHIDCTDEKGEFVIEGMRPGNYILVVNRSGRISAKNPFGAIFYPGVKERENAGVLSIEYRKPLTGRVIQLPPMVELVKVEGRFLFADDKPVPTHRVVFIPDDKVRFDEMWAPTDAAGGFVFQLPKGAVGKISGDFAIDIERVRNCPKLEQIGRASGEKFHVIKSSIEVSSLELPSSIELKLPFPYCEIKE